MHDKRARSVKLHIVGTHGVPANYGGFETLADHLCQELGHKLDMTVYCSAKSYAQQQSEYHGAKLVYIGIHASGFKGILYDMRAYFKALRKAEVILYLGPTGSGFLIPFRIFSKAKVLVNHGGLNEWEREKLNKFQRIFAKFNHRMAVKFAHAHIADNAPYQQSLAQHFGAVSHVIKYGSDKLEMGEIEKYAEKYPFLNAPYAVSVSRAQVDNKLHVLLECFSAFEDYPLVLVSNWQVSQYGRELKAKYTGRKNLILLDAIYDLEELNCIRGNGMIYIHSHSFCGTAPSLIEAMQLGRAVVSWDVPVNRETTEGKAMYFKSAEELAACLRTLSPAQIAQMQADMAQIARENYQWSKIAADYEELIRSLV